MRHDEASLTAFLEGDLSPTEATAFDLHLVDCDACWTAVQEDRRGRLLVESLRDTAPPSLRDRVRMVAATAQPTRTQQRRRWLTLPAAALVAVGLLLAPAVVARHRHDPEAVAAIVRLARTGADDPPAEMTAGRQRITVAHYRLGSHRVVVAQSAEHFAMPAGAHPLSPGQGSPWAASRAELHLLCYSHDRPALLAGDVPVAQLEAMAHSLGIS